MAPAGGSSDRTPRGSPDAQVNMPSFQLKYLGAGRAETIRADTPEDAEDLARRRLLFRDPGFAIAILFEGIELSRVIQRPRRWSSEELA